jgi:type IV pilus assembly protein PilA
MGRNIMRHLYSGEKGFTLIELLVVVAILGALAAVAVPSIGSFVDEGHTEAYESELHNIQSAAIALIWDSNAKQLDQDYTTPTGDMSSIKADSGNLSLDMYLTCLDNGTVRTNCLYTFSQNGTVTSQTTP